MSRTSTIALATLLLALPYTGDVAAGTDPMAEFRLEEAVRAMSEGDYQRGLDLCLLVVMTDNEHGRAHREAGRAAHALGRFQIAIDHLERSLELHAMVPDKEVHYLLGEAYYASGRKADAIRQHDEVRRLIKPGTQDRMELLWLARIHARRNELAEADKIYLRLLEQEPMSLEVKVTRIEAYTLSGRWAEAEKQVRALINEHPDYARGEEILAWVLEAQDKTKEERELRARLADETHDPQRLLAHARALERGGEYGLAMSRYEQALHRSDKTGDVIDEVEVRAAVSRLRYRLTPEAAAGGGIYTDPSGSLQRVSAGVAVPVHDQVTLSLLSSMDWAAGGAVPGAMRTGDVRVTTVEPSVAIGQGGTVSGAFTVSGSHFTFDGQDSSTRLGTQVDARVGEGKVVQLQTQLLLNMPWRETASTMREGGRELGATAVAYALPFGPRLIFDAGVRVRALKLEPIMDVESKGTQTTAVAGVDWVVWAPSTRTFRGQFLDDSLRWPSSYLSDSLTLSYRHYEAFTEDDFGTRLDLAARGTIDEVSAVARNTRPDGFLGFEGRAGAGNDWARDTKLWRVGASLLVTPLETLRGSLAYDYAQESTSGFAGQRHTAWASLHADF